MRIAPALLLSVSLAAWAAPPSPATREPAAVTTHPLTSADVIAGTTAADWRPLDPRNTLYVELPAGRVVIEMAPQFAPRHVANIEALSTYICNVVLTH